MLYFKTAGESHGKCLIAMVEGFPAGVFIDEAVINAELKRRQGGLGRGGRMQIEEERIEILSGVGVTRPICHDPMPQPGWRLIAPSSAESPSGPRPGHA